MSSPATRRTRTALRQDASSEVRESIEAKATPAVSNNDDEEDADGEADPDMDAEGDEEDAEGDIEMPDAIDVAMSSTPMSASGPRSRRDLLHLIETTAHYLSSYEEKGQEIALGFQRIPNKRLLPDYFDVIKEPTAFSTIRAKVQKRVYTEFSEFVRDVALICHNAQVYNRPSAPIFHDAVRLRQVLVEKLAQLVKDGSIESEDATLPDLGEIPDSPAPLEEEEGDEEEEEEESEEEEEEEDDDESDSRRARRRSARLPKGAKRQKYKEDEDEDDELKKHGRRPPTVYTPTESRIHEVLKGLRKVRDRDGEVLLGPFEKLPDKTLLPEYYEEIKQPMAVDVIKRKSRMKKYNNVDEALADLELMFNNAQTFNQDGSEIFEAAVQLQRLARQLVAQEKAKPDESFRDSDGKLPIVAVQAIGQTWRVGDWVHIRNPNDPRKPIVAQIFRLWVDAQGVQWLNACWYYRPEQTVHRFDKHFYAHEVVKTSQYRDHRADELVGRCFVMFGTRFGRGRPRGLPRETAVYVCEYRYNEEKCRFNRIKTWAGCLPDEVRDTDYEMDLFPVPQRLPKMPSPIKHLLREDAKETDPLPKATWASPNAPPMIGAVHRRPRLPNESPPPEAHGHPHMSNEMHIDAQRRLNLPADTAMTGTPQFIHPSPGTPGSVVPSPSPQLATAYAQQQFVPRPGHPSLPPGSPAHIQPSPHQMHSQMQPIAAAQRPQGVPGAPALPPQGHHLAPAPGAPHFPPQRGFPGTPQPQPIQSPMMAQQQHQQPLQPNPHMPVGANVPLVAPGYPQQPPQQQQPLPHQIQQRMAHSPAARPQAAPMPPVPNGYIPPRPASEAFTLPPDIDSTIPANVRKHYHCDEKGRVVFFTAPSARHTPADSSKETAGSPFGVSPEYAGLGHSVHYLNGLEDFREERRQKRKARDAALAEEARETAARRAQEQEEATQRLYSAAGEAIGGFVQWMNEGTRLLVDGDDEVKATKSTAVAAGK